MSLQHRFQENLNAIETVKTLSNKVITQAEIEVLKKYSGWGGFSSYFTDEKNSKKIEELKSIVTRDEYESLYRGVLDAFYTPEEVSEYIYSIFKSAGLKSHHSIIDPALGLSSLVKPYIGKNQITGIEKDLLTSRIVSAAYPEIDVKNSALEKTTLLNGSFDFSVVNPPYGDHQIFDIFEKELSKLPIHEYFTLKTLKLLKPGGVMALVVTSSMLDKVDNKTRLKLMQNVRLIGAWRLPKNTFSQTNTNVSTDLIFLQKRDHESIEATFSAKEKEFLTSKAYIHNGKRGICNSFIFNSQNSNKLEFEQGRFGLQLRNNGDLIELFNCINMPFFSINTKLGVLAEPDDGLVSKDKLEITDKELDSYPKFSYRSHSKAGVYIQRITENRFRVCETIKVGSTKEKRLLAAYKLANQLHELQSKENTICNDDSLVDDRNKLSKLYEDFVKKFGSINGSNNRFLLDDNELLPIFGLEKNYKRKITEKQALRQKVKPQKESWDRANILTERIYYPIKFNDYAFTPKQALTISLIRSGKVELDKMEEHSSFTKDQLIKALEGDLIFFDPVLNHYVVRDQYIAGNIRQKYKEAKEANLECNMLVLKEAMPHDVLPHQLDIPFLAGWLPVSIIEDFVEFIIGAKGSDIKPAYGRFYAELSESTSCKDTDYGTADLQAFKILQKLINKTAIVVKEKCSFGGSVVNQSKTLAALDKAELIKRDWSKFITLDNDRLNELTNLYNETMNCYVSTKYSGKHLTIKEGVFKGQNPNFKYRPHQVNAIWRQLIQRGGLLAHEVGAGKTSCAIAIAFLGVEMGLLTNPILAVPRNVLHQWFSEFKTIFPNANILLVDDANKTNDSETRRRLLSRAKSSKWHAILCTHETFTSIQMPIDGIYDALSDLKMSSFCPDISLNDDSGTARAIAKRIISIENKAEKAIEKATLKRGFGFEELNTNHIFIDESDLFKNAQFVTSFHGVKGLGNPEGSGRSMDLLTKIRHVNNKHTIGSRGVSFLTGTAISNSISESFTLARYLYNDHLKFNNLAAFDSFITTYSTESTEYEFNANGQFKLQTRFRDFVNLSELQVFFHNFSDCISNDYLIDFYEKNGKVWPIPKLAGGKPIDCILKPCQSFKQYNQFLIERTENFGKNGNQFFNTEYENDNMLSVITDSRKASLDLRLLNDLDNAGVSLDDYESCKSIEVVNNVINTFDEYDIKLNGQRTAQIIFVDLGTPKETSENVYFSVYQDIKNKLLVSGYLDSEIAFIHDAKNLQQQSELFKKVRTGEIRVLIGSTMKLGAGTNIQDRLIAIHHVTLDWKPRALIQQIGRIQRQGNIFFDKSLDLFYKGLIQKEELFEIKVFRYAVESSLDLMMIQANQIKAKFIDSFLSDDFSTRKISLRDESSIDHSEFKARASGKPELLLKHKNDNVLRRLFAMKEDCVRKNKHTAWRISNLPNEISFYKYSVNELEVFSRYSGFFSNLVSVSSSPRTQFLSKGKFCSSFKSVNNLLIHLLNNAVEFCANSVQESLLLISNDDVNVYVTIDVINIISLEIVSGENKVELLKTHLDSFKFHLKHLMNKIIHSETILIHERQKLVELIDLQKTLLQRPTVEFIFEEELSKAKLTDQVLTIALESSDTVIDGINVSDIEVLDLDKLLYDNTSLDLNSDNFTIKTLDATEYEPLKQSETHPLLIHQKININSKNHDFDITKVKMSDYIEDKNGQFGFPF